MHPDLTILFIVRVIKLLRIVPLVYVLYKTKK